MTEKKPGHSGVDKSNAGRIRELDGIRGVAALIVAIGHSFLILKIGNISDIWMRSFSDQLGL